MGLLLLLGYRTFSRETRCKTGASYPFLSALFFFRVRGGKSEKLTVWPLPIRVVCTFLRAFQTTSRKRGGWQSRLERCFCQPSARGKSSERGLFSRPGGQTHHSRTFVSLSFPFPSKRVSTKHRSYTQKRLGADLSRSRTSLPALLRVPTSAFRYPSTSSAEIG